MNLRIDKVVRFASFGTRWVYSLVLTDECLYLIRTGSFGALKHYRVDSASRQLIADRPDDRLVKEIQANEARIDSMPLDQLLGGDNYVVRLGAIEDVAIQTGTSPIMILKLTGSDHRFMFPFAPIEQVQSLRSALLRSNVI
ncbi:MAG TPA: hypothetical protein VFK30_06350 [Anaerolineae bacterium]|nr:hypothetical protein [Anaerolineae bacterium]